MAAAVCRGSLLDSNISFTKVKSVYFRVLTKKKKKFEDIVARLDLTFPHKACSPGTLK